MIPGSANPLLLKSAAAAGGYQIERSLRFNSSDSGYCSRTFTSAGNRKTWTWAGWVKRSNFSGSDEILLSARTDASNRLLFGFNSDGASQKLSVYINNAGSATEAITVATFRDPSAWYHVLLCLDTTQATAASRIKIYINSIEQTLSGSFPAQNYDTQINNNVGQYIGTRDTFNSSYFNGYLADIHFIDGQALTPSSFTEVSATTGQLIPKAYTGSFGTNGFWLKFSDNSNTTATTLGKDYSGNSNNWTPNNLSVTAGAGNDSLVDTPTSYGTDTGAGGEVRGNYCCFNALSPVNATLTNGNLDVSIGNQGRANSTFSVSSGKWYYEATMISQSSNPSYGIVGIGDIGSTSEMGTTATSWGYRDDAKKINSNSLPSYGATYTVGDVIGIAWNADTGDLTFYKNGVSQGIAYSNVLGNFGPAAGRNGNPVPAFAFNFGQRAFAYTAPSGFKALCDTNLPAPVVAKPNTVMDVKLYTGTGSSPRTLTGLNFSPDFVWIKSRNNAGDTANGVWHNLADIVRGGGKTLFSNSTGAEATNDSNGYLSAFTSDGFTLTAGTNSSNNNNNATGTYVAWTWDAGSSTVSNTQGSITSQVRTNGYLSIVTYTGNGSGGATFGHGLGVAPEFVIFKTRGVADDWRVYHKQLDASAPANYYLMLQSTNAKSANQGTSFMNSTAPSSTLITLGSDSAINGNGRTMVCYAFSPVAGYSSFGSYTGNGSADGPFVFCGFRPRWILVKRTDGVIQWTILDTARSPSNVADQRLFPNLSQAETVNGDGNTDLLSNGFKPRNIDSAFNANGGTYIYAAFAENPFQYARAR